MNECLLTFDLDWVPDWMIFEIAEALIDHGIRATWFATNPGEALDFLIAQPLFEVGMHPNFMPGSTHGKSVDEVMAHLRCFLPEAVSCRTHGLVQSSGLLKTLCEDYGVEIDSSIYLHHSSGITPHRLQFSPDGPALFRLPIFFEDDLFLAGGGECRHEALMVGEPGIKVYNFHPVHIILNSSSAHSYELLKEEVGIPESTKESVALYKNPGDGIGELFKELISYMKGKGESVTMKQFRDGLA